MEGYLPLAPKLYWQRHPVLLRLGSNSPPLQMRALTGMLSTLFLNKKEFALTNHVFQRIPAAQGVVGVVLLLFAAHQKNTQNQNRETKNLHRTQRAKLKTNILLFCYFFFKKKSTNQGEEVHVETSPLRYAGLGRRAGHRPAPSARRSPPQRAPLAKTGRPHGTRAQNRDPDA